MFIHKATEVTTVTRRLEWDAGHRVLGHGGKCRHIHGHRYSALITCTASGLDSLGMVVDFSVVKERIGGWIDEQWDHNLLLNNDDPLLDPNAPLKWQDKELIFGGRLPFTFAGNPTAEVLAKHLFEVSVFLLKGRDITVTEVTVYETPNCSATFTRTTTAV